MDLTQNEKRLIVVLAGVGSASPYELAEKFPAPEEAVLQYAHLLQARGLATVERQVEKQHFLTDEGKRYASEGLPERQLLDSFSAAIPMADLSRHPLRFESPKSFLDARYVGLQQKESPSSLKVHRTLGDESIYDFSA